MRNQLALVVVVLNAAVVMGISTEPADGGWPTLPSYAELDSKENTAVVPGEESMLDISSGGAKATLAESQEDAYDEGVKLATQMKKEIAATRQKAAAVQAQHQAEVAADAEEYAAEQAEKPTAEQVIRAQEVTARIAQRELARQQRDALREANHVTHEMEDFKRLGETPAESREDAHVDAVKAAMAAEVDTFAAQEQEMEKEAGLEMGSSLQKKKDTGKKAFSTAELDKLDAAGKATEELLKKGIASGFKGLRAKAGSVKAGLAAQGKSLDDGNKATMVLKARIAQLETEKANQVRAAPVKIATGKSAKYFLNQAQQANGKLEAKLGKLSNALAAAGGKVLAKRDSSLEARIDALAAQVRNLKAKKEITKGAAANKPGSLQAMREAVAEAMKIANVKVADSLNTKLSTLQGEEKKQYLLVRKVELQNEIKAMERAAVMDAVTSTEEQAAAKRSARLDLITKEDKLKQAVSREKSSMQKAGRAEERRLQDRQYQKQAAAKAKLGAAQDSVDMENVGFMKVKVQLEVDKTTAKNNKALFQSASTKAAVEMDKDSTALIMARLKAAKLKRQISKFQISVNGAKWEAESAAAEKAAAAAAAARAERKLGVETAQLALSKEAKADAVAAVAVANTQIAMLAKRLAGLAKLKVNTGAIADETAKIKAQIEKLKKEAKSNTTKLLAQAAIDDAKQNKLKAAAHAAKTRKAEAAAAAAAIKAGAKTALKAKDKQEQRRMNKAQAKADRTVRLAKNKLATQRKFMAGKLKAAQAELTATQASAAKAAAAAKVQSKAEKKKIAFAGASAMADAKGASVKVQAALVKQVVAAKSRAHAIASLARQMYQKGAQKGDEKVALARADAVGLENRANERCLKDTNAAERTQDAALNAAKAKTLGAQAAMAAAKEREARLSKEAAYATATAAVKAIKKMASTTKKVVEAKIVKKVTPAEAEKRAMEEETKRTIQAELIKANTIASGFRTKITKWKEMEALSTSTGAELKANIAKLKLKILNSKNKSNDHRVAMVKNKADADRKTAAADKENENRRKLKRDKAAAKKGKDEAEHYLNMAEAKNTQMKLRVAELLAFKAKTTKEKRLAVADRFQYQHELTQSEIKTQKGKLAVIQAKKKYAGEKAAVQAAKTKAMLAQAKAEEKKADSTTMPK